MVRGAFPKLGLSCQQWTGADKKFQNFGQFQVWKAFVSFGPVVDINSWLTAFLSKVFCSLNDEENTGNTFDMLSLKYERISNSKFPLLNNWR